MANGRKGWRKYQQLGVWTWEHVSGWRVRQLTRAKWSNRYYAAPAVFVTKCFRAELLMADGLGGEVMFAQLTQAQVAVEKHVATPAGIAALDQAELAEGGE